MSGEPLTLAEAVPLGTVHLQRLLAAAGVRSLVIKGPAFVELGVRKPRQSNDIDLFVDPGDRQAAIGALVAGGWSNLSPWYPRVLDDVTYSMTFCHRQFPVTVDLHHHFAGLLADDAFTVLWSRRTQVTMAHSVATVPCREDAFVIEALNAMKSRTRDEWDVVSQRVAERANATSLSKVTRSAELLGALQTAAPVISALGGSAFSGEATPSYRRWAAEAGSDRPRLLVAHLIRRAPWAIPGVVWSRIAPRAIQASFGMGSQEIRLGSYGRLVLQRIVNVLTR